MSNDYMCGFSTSTEFINELAEIVKKENVDVSWKINKLLHEAVTIEVTFKNILTKENYKKLATMMLENIAQMEAKGVANEWQASQERLANLKAVETLEKKIEEQP